MIALINPWSDECEHGHITAFLACSASCSINRVMIALGFV
jgi:hypothetical protein